MLPVLLSFLVLSHPVAVLSLSVCGVTEPPLPLKVILSVAEYWAGPSKSTSHMTKGLLQVLDI